MNSEKNRIIGHGDIPIMAISKGISLFEILKLDDKGILEKVDLTIEVEKTLGLSWITWEEKHELKDKYLNTVKNMMDTVISSVNDSVFIKGKHYMKEIRKENERINCQ